jgi:hypothetical protein
MHEEPHAKFEPRPVFSQASPPEPTFSKDIEPLDVAPIRLSGPLQREFGDPVAPEQYFEVWNKARC